MAEDFYSTMKFFRSAADINRFEEAAVFEASGCDGVPIMAFLATEDEDIRDREEVLNARGNIVHMLEHAMNILEDSSPDKVVFEILHRGSATTMRLCEPLMEFIRFLAWKYEMEDESVNGMMTQAVSWSIFLSAARSATSSEIVAQANAILKNGE